MMGLASLCLCNEGEGEAGRKVPVESVRSVIWMEYLLGCGGEVSGQVSSQGGDSPTTFG
jgi:hypothetical protein